jgi:hypothetical protein
MAKGESTMKAKINAKNGTIEFARENGDPKFHGQKEARGEKRLFHFLCKWLNKRGFALIPVNAQDDGHMLGDKHQPLARPRKRGDKDRPNIAFYSGFYALRGANEDWNKEGKVEFLLVLNYFDGRPDAYADMLVGVSSDDINII